MPAGGTYGGNPDTVTDHGSTNGWAAQGGSYGAVIAGRPAYCFGPILNNWGTWGQLIYDQPGNLGAEDLGNPTGLNGVMPGGNAPDNSMWIQGHLVNGECGGAGNLAANLTPISHNINMLHRGYEAVVQRLANAGPLRNSIIRMFNPNGIANCRIIYRTHRLPGPADNVPVPVFPLVPHGIVVSLGIVINNVMMSAAQVALHFAGVMGGPAWFANWYYTGAAAGDRLRIGQMIGGVQFNY